METLRRRLAVIIAYFLVYVVWGSTYFFIGVALRGLPTFTLGALRFTAAGALLLALCLCRGEAAFRPGLVRRSVVSGLVLLFIDMLVIMWAQRYVSSSLVAIVASSTAVWIMMLDVPEWRRNFRSPARVAGVLAGFAGVAMLYAEQWLGESGSPDGAFGMLLLVGGCVSWALGTLYSKYRACSSEAVNGFAGSAWQMLAAGLAFWAGAGLSGDWQRTDFAAVSPVVWAALAYLVVCGSVLAYSAYIWLLKVRPATEVATHAYVNPVIAVLLGTMLGGERVTLLQLLGLAVILGSVMLTTGVRRK